MEVYNLLVQSRQETRVLFLTYWLVRQKIVILMTKIKMEDFIAENCVSFTSRSVLTVLFLHLAHLNLL